jgi:hypothetical protein
MEMLSKTERAFVEGKLKPNPNYKYVLIHRIKKKRQKMIEELKLIEEFLKSLKKNLNVNCSPQGEASCFTRTVHLAHKDLPIENIQN